VVNKLVDRKKWLFERLLKGLRQAAAAKRQRLAKKRDVKPFKF